MKYINCILCGSNDYLVIFKNRMYGALKTFGEEGCIAQKVVCKSCGFIYQNPTFTAEELSRIYSLEYNANKGGPTSRFIKEKTYRATDQIRWLNRYIDLGVSLGTKVVLDIGSAAGILLVMFKEKGWIVEGIEPQIDFAEYSRTTYGLKVHTGFLEDFMAQKSRYDLIIMSHVLEHIPDPISVFLKLSSYLKPQGALFIETPNILGIWRNMYDQMQGTHLFIASLNTMRVLAYKAGFRVVRLESRSRIMRCLLYAGREKMPKNTRDDYRFLYFRVKSQQLTSWLFNKIKKQTGSIERGDSGG